MHPIYIFLVLLFYSGESRNLPCPRVLTINITDGQRVGSSIEKDGILFKNNNYFTEDETIFGCICNIKSCIRKCCGPNEIMIERNCTQTNHTMNVQIHDGAVPTNVKANHHLIHNMDCDRGKYLLTPHQEYHDAFYIQKNGSIFLPNVANKPLRNSELYCVETFDFEELEMKKMVSVMLCEIEEDDIEEPKKSVPMIHVGMIISMPFLLATFIVYALLPDRNLHMKALMFYVITLMVSYLLLVIVQLKNSAFSDPACASIGYLCIFFFLVSFFWMNVICVDIWYTFSGLRGFSGSKKIAERKRFYLYCAYAWFLPLVHVLIVLGLQLLGEENSWFHPGIGKGQCFLKKGYPELLYFYGPVALLILINVVLFTHTAIQIRTVKKDTSVLQKEDSKRHSYENDKQTFNLYLKLLFAMGVNWSLEIISWAVIWAQVVPESIWYLTDFCNAIYGVFIFFIFVYKKNIWRLLKKRYYWFMGKSHLAHSMSTHTTRTTTTSYSTAHPMSENPQGNVRDTTTLTSEA